MADQPDTIVIDGKPFDFATLSAEVKTHIGNVRITDEEIERLRRQLEMVKTARASYVANLKALLPAD